MRKTFYIKNSKGEYSEVDFNVLMKDIEKDWENKIIVASICSGDGQPLSDREYTEIYNQIKSADIFQKIASASFVVMDGRIGFRSLRPEDFSPEDRLRLMKAWVSQDRTIIDKV